MLLFPLLQFLLIIADRVIYLYKSSRMKLLLHVVVTLGFFMSYHYQKDSYSALPHSPWPLQPCLI